MDKIKGNKISVPIGRSLENGNIVYRDIWIRSVDKNTWKKLINDSKKYKYLKNKCNNEQDTEKCDCYMKEMTKIEEKNSKIIDEIEKGDKNIDKYLENQDEIREYELELEKEENKDDAEKCAEIQAKIDELKRESEQLLEMNSINAPNRDKKIKKFFDNCNRILEISNLAELMENTSEEYTNLELEAYSLIEENDNMLKKYICRKKNFTEVPSFKDLDEDSKDKYLDNLEEIFKCATYMQHSSENDPESYKEAEENIKAILEKMQKY